MRTLFRRFLWWLLRRGQEQEEITYTITNRSFLEDITMQTMHNDQTAALSGSGEGHTTVMYQRLLDAYKDAPTYQEWRAKMGDVESVQDFRSHHWMRFGGYGDLPVIEEKDLAV